VVEEELIDAPEKQVAKGWVVEMGVNVEYRGLLNDICDDLAQGSGGHDGPTREADGKAVQNLVRIRHGGRALLCTGPGTRSGAIQTPCRWSPEMTSIRKCRIAWLT
jgi:hypothetical protein